MVAAAVAVVGDQASIRSAEAVVAFGSPGEAEDRGQL